MTLWGRRMKPLGGCGGRVFCFAAGRVVLTVLSVALMDARSPTAAPMPLKSLLLAGIAGLLGGCVSVQCTWKPRRRSNIDDEAAPDPVKTTAPARPRTARRDENGSPQAVKATLASISEEVTG